MDTWLVKRSRRGGDTNVRVPAVGIALPIYALRAIWAIVAERRFRPGEALPAVRRDSQVVRKGPNALPVQVRFDQIGRSRRRLQQHQHCAEDAKHQTYCPAPMIPPTSPVAPCSSTGVSGRQVNVCLKSTVAMAPLVACEGASRGRMRAHEQIVATSRSRFRQCRPTRKIML